IGGFLARRLIPIAVAFPILFGIFRIWGEEAGLYGSQFGIAALTLANLLFFSVLIGWIAWVLANVDAKRLQSEREMRRSEERFSLISKITNDAVWDWDLNTDSLWWSEGIERTFGFDLKAIPPSINWWYDHIHPEDRDRVVSGIHHVIESGKSEWQDEYRYRRHSGDYVDVLDIGFVIRDSVGKPLRMLGGMTDITERKRAEAALADALSRLSLAQSGARFGIFDWLIPEKKVIWTPELEELYEIPLGSFEQTYDAWARRTTPEDLAAVERIIQTSVEERRENADYEFRAILPTGRTRWLIGKAKFFYAPDGQPRRMIGILVDADEQKRREMALRENEQRLKTITNNTESALLLLDITGRITFMNPAFHRITGYTAEDVAGKTAHEVVHHKYPDGRPYPIEECPIDRSYLDIKPASNIEEIFVRKDGSLFPVLASVSPLTAPDGTAIGGVVEFRDISEQKRLQAALRESEEKLRLIFDSTYEGIALHTPEGKLLDVNQTFLRMYHLTYAQALETTIEQLSASSMPIQKAGEIWSKVVAGDEQLFFWKAKRPGDGSEFDVEVFLRPLKMNDQAVILGTIRDVSERIRMEESLRAAKENAERSRTQLLAVFSSMTEGVAIAAPDGRILDVNPAALSIHGFESLGELKRSIQELGNFIEIRDLAGRLLPLEAWPVARALRGETFMGYEVRVSRRDTGASFIGSYGGAPIRNADGEIMLAVTTLRDIARQQEAEQALAQAKEQLERHAQELEKIVDERTARLHETIHELEAFSYSLSHDMRAPLRAMKGFSQILQTDFGPQIGQEGNLYLEKISTAAGRLDQLIQDVLTYSRIVREAIELQPVDAERLLKQLIDENPALQPPSAVIEVQSPLLPMLGHDAYLTQVLSNLVYNSVKFVAKGKQPVVRVWTETIENDVRLCIKDNGIGIPKEAQSRLFKMFERLHSEKDYEGTGIGLSIVRKAVERMGGQISFESREGDGTTFYVRLRKGQTLT
ncbi:MAG: PAS domain S-box protein, partial [Limisphaerales bacterium]